MMEEPSHRHLRRFGFTVAAGLTVIGLVSWNRDHLVVPWTLWAIAGLLGLLGLLMPRLLIPVQRAWMALGMALGWLNTRIILTILFYATFTPIGAIMRWFRDPLDRQLQKERASYWVRREPLPMDPKTYERQF
jgi:hypothetical protein